jgi:hypothetical protein
VKLGRRGFLRMLVVGAATLVLPLPAAKPASAVVKPARLYRGSPSALGVRGVANYGDISPRTANYAYREVMKPERFR